MLNNKTITELPLGTYRIYVPPDVYEVSQTYSEPVDPEHQIFPGIVIMADPHLPKGKGVAWSRNEKGNTEITIVHFNEQSAALKELDDA